MRESIFGFVLAGLVVGCAVGAVQAVFGFPSNHGLHFLLGSVGLHGLFALLITLVLGTLHPFVPANLELSSLIKSAKGHLLPHQDDALQGRCRVVTTIWVTGFTVIGSIHLLNVGYHVLLSRVQAPEFAAVGVALFGLAVITTVLAFATPVRAAGSRLFETLIRRNTALTFLVHPLGNLILALTLCAVWMVANADRDESLVKMVPWVPVLAFTVIVFGSVAGGEWIRERLVRLTWLKCLQLCLIPIFLTTIGAVGGLRSPGARVALAKQPGLNQLMITAMRAPFDQDEDGFSSVLSGGDCNDSDPNIHPNALDIPGSGVDENCDGQMAVQKVNPTTVDQWPVSLDTLGFRPPYSVVLVTVESLRSDHVGFYGYGRETTPAIDDLAAESVVFRKAYSVSSTPQMSVASIMSGRYPSELMRDRGFFPKFDQSNIFIAELLAESGFHTAGFPSHWYFREESGFEQGFGLWQPYAVERGRMRLVPTAETVVTAAVEHLHRLAPDPERPYFLWLHIIDPQPRYIAHLDVPRFGASAVDRYDHELRYVDTWLEWFFETLRRREDWKRTVVVLAGTQGESFQKIKPARLSQADLNVPLMVRVPGLQPRPVEAPVSLVDIMPTLLDLAGLEANSPKREKITLRGTSLLPHFIGRDQERKPIFAELPQSDESAMQLAWLDGNTKLSFDGRENTWKLFDITRDPWEQEDLLPTRPALGARLKTSMRQFRSNLTITPARR